MGNLACLGYIRDEQLPGYEGFIVHHFNNPYETTRIQWKVRGFLGGG